MTHNTEDLIKFRLEEADEALSAAHLLLSQGMVRSAVNRAYYAMFYAVLALLVKSQLKSSKHSGTIALFQREYVGKGILEVKYSRLMRDLFAHRQRTDYREFYIISEMKATSLISEVESFIKEAKSILKAQQ